MYSLLVQFYLHTLLLMLTYFIPYFAPFNFQSLEFLRVLLFRVGFSLSNLSSVLLSYLTCQ